MATADQDFRTLFESAPGLFLVLAPDAPRYSIVAVTDAFARATSTKREEIVGRGLFEVFPDNPDDPEASGARNTSASLNRVVTHRVPDAMAVQRHDIRRPEEAGGGFETRWWSPVNSPVIGANGELLYLIHRVEDVSEFVSQKRAFIERTAHPEKMESEIFQRGQELQKANRMLRDANEQLTASEAKSAGLVFISSDAILSVDGHQRITMFNEGAEKIFGYRRSEVIGQPLDLLIPARFRSAHAKQMERFGEGGRQARKKGDRQVVFGKRKNGEEFPAEAAIAHHEVDKEKIFSVVVRDVTEQRSAERTIRKSEAYFRLLSRTGDQLARSLDHTQTLQNVADFAVPDLADWCVVVAIGADGAVGSIAWSQRRELRPEVVAEFCSHYRSLCDDPRSLFSRVRRQLCAIRTEFTGDAALCTVLPERVSGQLAPKGLIYVPLVARGQLLGVLCCCVSTREYSQEDQDIAEDVGHRLADALERVRLLATVEQARDAALKASDARDQVLSIVAHDLRNPLNALTLCVQQLIRASTKEGGTTPTRALELIRNSAHQMNLLIDDLVAKASFETGGLTIVRSPHSVAAIVTEVIEAFSGLALARGLSLTANTTKAGWVSCDRLRLLQVLGNLLSNAFKITRKGGAISIDATQLGAAVRFSVTDNGSGISPEACLHIFDRNWPGRTAEGLGLGLYIAKLLVEAHGGQMAVDSKVDVGTTFTFSLPVATGPELGPPPVRSRAAEAPPET